MQEPVYLWYLSNNLYGGWATYTSHLLRSLRACGIETHILKNGNKTETKHRPFGYGCLYWNVAVDDDDIPDGTHIVTAIGGGGPKDGPTNREWAEDLLLDNDLRAINIFHDPAEFSNPKNSDWRATLESCRNIVIRENNARFFSDDRVRFVPHPYIRTYPPGTRSERNGKAVSYARVDFDKNVHILLDANRLGAEISIRGFENRLYTKFKIVPDYPEWEQSVGHYERTDTASVDLAHQHQFVCDMSTIVGDGGGTQYTFLEAWDAGATLIVNSGWGQGELVFGRHAYAVSDGEELAALLTWLRENPEPKTTLQENADRLLERHSPSVVVPAFQSAVQDLRR